MLKQDVLSAFSQFNFMQKWHKFFCTYYTVIVGTYPLLQQQYKEIVLTHVFYISLHVMKYDIKHVYNLVIGS